MKTNTHTIRLMGVIGVFGILSWITTGNAKELFEELSTLVMAAFLVVTLVGMVAERRALVDMVAERRALEAKLQVDTK